MTDSVPVGLVAIGRNEGERLVRCLRSARAQQCIVVYVDSGSTDGSVETARDLGAEVVELDAAVPFTAARARNAGFERLMELAPAARYAQFVDGDCELCDGWIAHAVAYLESHLDVGIACGRRRERFPDATVYNRLADMEWDTPVGDATECGGDALIRVDVFRQVGGYREDLIAGEDPELALRVRRSGHAIHRLDCDMTLHDAAMTRFGQWWRRTRRAGHAYAESAWLHGSGPERYRVRELVSIVAWGGVLPSAALLLAGPTLGASMGVSAAAYATLWSRVYRTKSREALEPKHAALYATGCTVGKLAEMTGVTEFAWNRFVRQKRSRLIEYKG